MRGRVGSACCEGPESSVWLWRRQQPGGRAKFRPGAALVAAGLLVAIQLSLITPTEAAGTSAGWVPPLDAPVVDPFRPPASRFGAGNRGLEYGTSGGERVLAVGDGVVSFAGRIGNQRFVTVQHPDGLRSTYAYLERISVVRGQVVRQGQQVAIAAAGFHLTARLGGEYVDPALLFVGAAVVMALVESELPTVPVSAGPSGPDIEGDPLAAASQAARDLSLSSQLQVAAEAVEAWYREDCTPTDAAVAPAGEGRILVQVAGLGSSAGEGSIGSLGAASVGYAEDDVVGFSYTGGCTPAPFGHDGGSALSEAVAESAAGPGATSYQAEDTYQDINVSAAHLADLIEVVAAERPDQPIDVVAHSQGGVVARRALEILAERGSVAPSVLLTVASPHQGTDLANAAVAAGGDTAITELIDDVAPMRGADSVTQMAEAGEHRLPPPGPPPDGTTVVAIAGATDLIVPADAAIWDGAENVIVPTTAADGTSVHSDLPGDPVVARELNLAIAGAPPGCVALAAVLGSVANGRAISTAEDAMSVILGLTSFVL